MKGSHWKWETFWVEGTLISLCRAFCHHRDEKRSSKLHFPLVCCYWGAVAAGSSCTEISRAGWGWAFNSLQGTGAASGSPSLLEAFLLVYYSVLISCTWGLGFICVCGGKERRAHPFVSIKAQFSSCERSRVHWVCSQHCHSVLPCSCAAGGVVLQSRSAFAIFSF